MILFRWLATLLVVVHATFVVFVLFGGLGGVALLVNLIVYHWVLRNKALRP